jgi:PAS domain S-box-containing protein
MALNGKKGAEAVRSSNSSKKIPKIAKIKAPGWTGTPSASPSRADSLILLEQFRIQQIELEMQNDELRRIQADLEASRSRYFDLYHLAPVGYITLNDSGWIIESNLRAAALFGVDHLTLNKRNFSRSVANTDTDVYHLSHRRLLRSGTPQVCELRLKRHNGSIFWGRLEMSLAANGALEDTRIVIIDISERKRAEQRFDAFMDNTPALASIVDESGRYVYVNPALQRYSGREAKAWLGKTFFEVWPPSIAMRMSEQHGRALKSGELTSQMEALPLGSVERVGQVLRFPFAGVNGQRLVGFISLDVTERHQLEKALLEANRQLAAERNAAERATNAKSHFLSAMSHEIRTPLNGVVGMAGLLLQTELTAEQAGYARIVSDSAEILLDLVNDVLDLAKIEAGKLELEESPFDLESLVEEALSLVSFKAHEKSLQLACRYPEELPRLFVGDAGRIRQILNNFLSNAVKFTQAGHVLVEVEMIDSAAGVSTLRLAVTDTGIGIPPENLAQLFTRFAQADARVAALYGGTGLGLSIVKQLVEMMGGEVGAHSLDGRGSTFYCTIPLRVQQPAAVPSNDAGGAFRGVPVLIAAGSRISGAAVAELCRRWEMKVSQCNLAELSARLATARDKGCPYQLVIVDGARESLQQADLTIAPTLILISSDTREKTRDLVADAILYTPVRARLLRETLTQLVGRPAAPLSEANHSAEGAEFRPPLPALRVLVADDNVINQKLACALLKKMGCLADTADDGVAAVDKVRANAYDLVLMDCVMPQMDGFEATTAIRNLAGACASVPIVALTASVTNEDRDRCLAAGMTDFLSKPVRQRHLEECLLKWTKKTLTGCS